MDVKELAEWESKELEITKKATDKLLNKPKATWEDKIKVVYPELNFERPYAYRQDLGVPITLLLPFYKQVIFHIDSFKSENVFKLYHNGLKPEELAKLYRRNRIILLMASQPTEYIGLEKDYLDPILELKPPTVIRMRAFIMATAGSNDKLDEHMRKGKEIFQDKLEPRRIPGLYEELKSPRKCLEGHVISSYANLCSFGLSDLANEIVKSNTLNEAATILTIYDSLLIRPSTTGMLGQPQITREWASSIKRRLGLQLPKRLVFPVEVGRVLVHWYGLDFPLKPELHDIDELYKEKVMDSARRLFVELEDAIRREKGEESLEKSADILKVLKEAQEAIVTKMEKYKLWTKIGLFIAGVGSSLLTKNLFGELGLLSALALKVVSFKSELLAELLGSLKTPPLQTTLWDFKKKWDKTRP